MSDVVFVDSNILIYAHDADAGPKRECAVEPTTAGTVTRAIDIAALARVHFWDALIVACAEQADATALYSEDFNEGQIIAGVKIVNPLLGTRAV
jgi:predicted nucleic acid-binding protein